MDIRSQLCPILFLLLCIPCCLHSQPRIIYPNGGEIFRPGQDVTIRWDGVDAQTVVGLQYSMDDGESWSGIAGTITGGQFVWRVPDTPSDQCRVRITAGESTKVLSEHEYYLANASYGNNERYILASGYGAVKAWDPAVPAALWHASAWWARANPVYETAVTTSGQVAFLRNLKTGKVIDTLKGHKEMIQSARFSSDGLFLVTGSEDGTARVWNGITGELLHILAGHTAGLQDFRISGDGSRAITFSRDSTAKVWDLSTGQLLQSIHSMSSYFWMASTDRTGRWMAATSYQDTVGYIWDVQSGDLHRTVRARDYVLFSPDGTRLLTGNWDDGALLYDTGSGELLHSFDQLSAIFRVAAFSADGKQLIIVDASGETSLWATETGEFQRLLVGHQLITESAYGVVASAEFSRDGRHVITSGADKTVRIWDLDNTQQSTDVSDATFTIWPSTLAVAAVDMGNALYGRHRDSTITTVIRNPDSKPLRVENFRITGADSSNFALLPDLSAIEVPAGGTADLSLRFTPSRGGAHQAVLEMTAHEWNLKLQLRGTGVAVPLVPLVDTVDFGQVEMFKRRDTVIAVVRNMMNEAIEIDTVKTSGWCTIRPAVHDTLLAAGETLSVRLEFSPTSTELAIRPLLVIMKKGSTERDTARVEIRGEGVRPASVWGAVESRSAVTVYPNPAGERMVVEVEMRKAGRVEVVLRDVLGRMIQRESWDAVEAGRHELDVRGVASGACILEVETEEGHWSQVVQIVR